MPRLGQFSSRALHGIGVTYIAPVVPPVVPVSTSTEWLVLTGGFPTTSATVYAISTQASTLSTVSTVYSSFAASSYHFDAAVAPNNDFIYFPNGTKNWIDVVPISPNTGVYTGSGATTAAINGGSSFPMKIKISPDGKGAYVAYNNAGIIGIMNRNTSTGALTAVSNVSTGSTSIVISADNQNFYSVTNSGVVMYSRNTTTNALSYISTEVTVAISSPTFAYPAILITNDGNSVLVADYSAGSIHNYQRNTSTGVLTWQQTVATPLGSPIGIAASKDGKSVYAARYDPNQVMVGAVVLFTRSLSAPYSLTTSTTYVTGAAGGVQLTSLIVSKNQDVLTTIGTDGNLYSWGRNLTTGALTTNTTITGVAAGALTVNN